jgi:lariat debranching enzyme
MLASSGSYRDEDPTSIEEFGVSTSNGEAIRVAVEGCAQGALETIYSRLLQHQQQEYKKSREPGASSFRPIDLLLMCADFQSLRCPADWHSVDAPPRYRTSLGSFYRYFKGELAAPVLTIVIGCNHEVSQQLYSELFTVVGSHPTFITWE